MQGDISINNNEYDEAINLYNKAVSNSNNIINKTKYNLDMVVALIVKDDYLVAKNILEKIINIDEIGFYEKNTAEELLAFVNYKLGT